MPWFDLCCWVCLAFPLRACDGADAVTFEDSGAGGEGGRIDMCVLVVGGYLAPNPTKSNQPAPGLSWDPSSERRGVKRTAIF